jgi:predicted HTH transcriptional regulator
MLTEKELKELFEDIESDRVERKKTEADGKKIRDAICAFANDMPGHGKPGVIFVGVNDDGTCASKDIHEVRWKHSASTIADRSKAHDQWMHGCRGRG